MEEELGRLRGDREVGTLVEALVVGIIPLGDNPMVVAARGPGTAVIESHGIVEVLGYPAPLAALGPRTPHYIVIAWVVEVVEVHVHDGDGEILLPVHLLAKFLQRVALLTTEFQESGMVIHRTLFQFAVLQQVDVLQPVVVGDDVVGIGPFADVEHTPVVAVDIDHRGAPGLPVDVGIGIHRSLTQGIAHIGEVAVVARITQHHRLIVRQSWTLVGEELILHILLAETLMTVDSHRLSGSLSRIGTCDTCLTELVQLRGCPLLVEELDVQGPAPVHLLGFIVTVVILEDTYRIVVQIPVVSHKTDDGDCQSAVVEDIRLYAASGRQPSLADQFGADGRRCADAQRRGVFLAVSGGLSTVGRIVDLRSFW